MPVTEGIEALRRFSGSTPESTYGTAQTASTWLWDGVGINWYDNQRKMKEIPEKVGYFGGTNRRKLVSAIGMCDLPATPLNIWAVPNIMRYFGGIGPSTYTISANAGATGTAWTHKTALPTTARPTLTTFTAQTGNDFETEQATGCFFHELHFSGKEEDVAMVSAKVVGRAPEYLGGPGSFNPATPPYWTYNAAPVIPDTPSFGATKFYIDPISAAGYGLTQVSDTLLEFEITYKYKFKAFFMNNTTPVVTAGGQPGVSRIVLAGMDISGKVVYLYNANASASGGQAAQFNSDSAQRLRFRLFGRALAVADTGGPGPSYYTNQGVDLDVPAYYTAGGKVGARNGVDVIEFAFKSETDLGNMTTPDAGFVTTVVNGTHALAPTLP